MCGAFDSGFTHMKHSNDAFQTELVYKTSYDTKILRLVNI